LIPAALAIGGSDSCGGAGVQADLQTFSAFGVKGCSAITALTAQNPKQIIRIEPVPPAQLEAEIRAVFSYYDIRVVKTGMLYDAGRVRLVVRLLKELHADRPVIVDPVMISTSGKVLLDETALATARQELFPMASLLTPNIPEAEMLLGKALKQGASGQLSSAFSVPVLLKGGHTHSNKLIDVLSVHGEAIAFPHDRQTWNPEISHGTGCRLASAIAALLMQGKSLPVAVAEAIGWLQKTNLPEDGN
jgi:hydroxymethylpyrimidine/phosphomethylpyrimidine kinase